MKKSILKLVMLGVFIMSAQFAQAQNYQKGDNLLNFGIGVGGDLGLPIGLSYEIGFSDKISGGIYAGYSSKTQNVVIADWKWTHIMGAARASYHFNFNVDKLDPYVGVMLGYNYAKGKWSNGGGAGWPEPSAGGVIYGGHAGARYMFSNKMGVFAEVGYGIGNLNAGITFKL